MSPCKHLYLEWACLSELVYPYVVDFYCAMLFIRGTSQGSVCLSVCLSVSITSRSSTKTAIRRITQEHRTIAQRL